jgi:hypothetical protein
MLGFKVKIGEYDHSYPCQMIHTFLFPQTSHQKENNTIGSNQVAIKDPNFPKIQMHIAMFGSMRNNPVHESNREKGKENKLE